jgi:hypothetical protein
MKNPISECSVNVYKRLQTFTKASRQNQQPHQHHGEAGWLKQIEEEV